jgi:hypothetical protein
MIELTRDLLAGGDIITLGSLQVRLPDSQHISCTLIADKGEKRKKYMKGTQNCCVNGAIILQ